MKHIFHDASILLPEPNRNGDERSPLWSGLSSQVEHINSLGDFNFHKLFSDSLDKYLSDNKLKNTHKVINVPVVLSEFEDYSPYFTNGDDINSVKTVVIPTYVMRKFENYAYTRLPKDVTIVMLICTTAYVTDHAKEMDKGLKSSMFIGNGVGLERIFPKIKKIIFDGGIGSSLIDYEGSKKFYVGFSCIYNGYQTNIPINLPGGVVLKDNPKIVHRERLSFMNMNVTVSDETNREPSVLDLTNFNSHPNIVDDKTVKFGITSTTPDFMLKDIQNMEVLIFGGSGLIDNKITHQKDKVFWNVKDVTKNKKFKPIVISRCKNLREVRGLDLSAMASDGNGRFISLDSRILKTMTPIQFVLCPNLRYIEYHNCDECFDIYYSYKSFSKTPNDVVKILGLPFVGDIFPKGELYLKHVKSHPIVINFRTNGTKPDSYYSQMLSVILKNDVTLGYKSFPVDIQVNGQIVKR